MINHKKENKQNKKNLTYKISFNLLEKDFSLLIAQKLKSSGINVYNIGKRGIEKI